MQSSTGVRAVRNRTCWSTAYYDYYRYLLPAPCTGFACFSLQVLLYSYQTFHYSNSSCLCSLCYTLYSTAASPACMYCCTCTAVQQLARLCEKKLPLRHLLLAPSLRAPVRTAAVYVPVLTYAAVYPTDIIASGCCPVYVPAVRTGAGVGAIFALCC